tara:strand:+ start:7497 stop:7979 length:483 start_codon:yes stop_codon:yes gene_type:complete
MKLTAVAAVSKNLVIGKNNSLPWNIPEDLKRFKALTSGSPIIMGRKTYESIGRPLPNRINIVLTQKGYKSSDEIKIFKNLDNLLNYCEGLDSEVFVIGGSEIYKLLEPYCTRLVITHVLKEFDGDSFFPINLKDWNNVSSEKFTDESSELGCEIKIYNKA